MTEYERQFWDLVEEHRPALWRFSLGLTKSREDARDLTSETVLAAFRSFSRLRDRSTFRKSLFTIAVRIHRRAMWRRRIFAPNDDAINIEAPQSEESAYDLELLTKSLGALPERQREAILLFEISGLSLEEIRSVQGGSLSGVKSRVTRARETLRRLMTDSSADMNETTNYTPVSALL